MKTILAILGFLLLTLNTLGQDNNQLLEEIVEQITENNDEEIDFTELYESLYEFAQNPINLNKTNKEELQQLYLLNAYQIDKLLTHITENGKLLSHLELQSIAGFNLQTIEQLLPFITVKSTIKPRKIFSNINQHFFVRDQFYLQEQKGYISEQGEAPHYLGNSHKTYFKYRLRNNFLQAGITAEKDAGENFLGPNQPYGFDFYSAHLKIKNLKKIKTLLIGDYQLNFGQGLVMQSGISFGKSSEVINIQKTGNLIKPHTSAEENLFFRGTAMQINPIKNIQIIIFLSSKKVDANIIDTLENNELTFSSIQASGMHRTQNELIDKNTILQNHMGGHINYNYKQLNIGVSHYLTKINGEYQKPISPYNQFDFNANSNQNFGIDYQYLYKNINLFGEIAKSKNRGIAHINGVMLGLDKTISASLLYRNYAKEYQSEYAHAFSERSSQNEEGIYFGIEFTPNHKLKIKGYTDNYNFPWLRFGVDAPTKGTDYLLQTDYKINRSIKMYLRFKSEKKQEGINESTNLNNKRKESFRFHLNYKENDNWSFANRFEKSLTDFEQNIKNGYMIYQDIKYKPLFGRLSFTLRYVLFNTPDYDNRIYAYEHDVLYGYSIPAYYGQGNRIYIVSKYNIIKNLDIWFRIAQTTYSDRQIIKSGWDEITGNKITELKIQLRYKF